MLASVAKIIELEVCIMSEKIAIPTNGEVLDAHFGKAAGFTVFEIEGKEARFCWDYIGKEEFKEQGRPYIVSREGRFGRVRSGGTVRVGDPVEVKKASL